MPYEYDEMISEIKNNELLQVVEPSYARKLIEGAAAYAATLGFKPNPDYHTTKEIFGDIDPNACADEFTFGKMGKPFYVVGPTDSPLRRRQILATLEKNVGLGNFDFLAPIGGFEEYEDDDFEAFDDDDFEFEEDDDDDDDDDPKLLVGGRE